VTSKSGVGSNIPCSSKIELFTGETPCPLQRVRRNKRHIAPTALDQLQSTKARVPILADDDVIVHGDAERARRLDNRLVIRLPARDGVGSPDGS
jgi:hypothetical protein